MVLHLDCIAGYINGHKDYNDTELYTHHTNAHILILIFISYVRRNQRTGMGEKPVRSGSATFCEFIISSKLNGNPLQYSCLENPMDGYSPWFSKSRTRLSDLTE